MLSAPRSGAAAAWRKGDATEHADGGPATMRLTLCWTGPVGAGLFPEAADGLQALAVPGVYLRLKRYRRGRLIGYVGQSRNLLSRFDQHLADLFGLAVDLRDEDGRLAFARGFDGRLGCYRDVAAALALVRAEAERMRFFYAPCDEAFPKTRLNLVEGALRERMTARIAGSARLAAENRIAPPAGEADDAVVLDLRFDALAEGDAASLAALLGGEPIRVPLAAAEAAFDG